MSASPDCAYAKVLPGVFTRSGRHFTAVRAGTVPAATATSEAASPAPDASDALIAPADEVPVACQLAEAAQAGADPAGAMPEGAPGGQGLSDVTTADEPGQAAADETPDQGAGAEQRARDEAHNGLLDAVRVGLVEDSRAYARRARQLCELERVSRQSELAGVPQFPELEAAGSWHVSQLTAARWAADAHRLESCLPLTLAALEAGTLLVHQAQVLLHRTRSCPDSVAQAVEAELLPAAAGLTPADLRKRVDRCVLRIESEQASAEAAEQRHAEAASDRHVFTRPEVDGMAVAGAVLTAEQLVTWKAGLDRLEQRERVADRSAGIDRTAEQRRADLFAALPAMVLTGTALDHMASGAAQPAPGGGPCPCGRAADCCLRAAVTGASSPVDGAAASGAASPGSTQPCGATQPCGSTQPCGPLPGHDASAPGGRDGAPAPTGPMAPWTFDAADVAAQIVLNVLVPVATVLDLSREPGHLVGYGPVSAEHVRLVRPQAFRRVLVDSLTGVPLQVDDRVTPAAPDAAGRRRQVRDMLRPAVIVNADEPQHDPSARLARLVDLRDAHCCGPGCSSSRTDRDHLRPWPQGPTSERNLGRLSRRCHRAKHHGWTLLRPEDRGARWTSPLGRAYDRPGPHPPPPQVDLWQDSPPLRSAPVIRAYWPAAEEAGAPVPGPVPEAEQPVAPPADDEPPF